MQIRIKLNNAAWEFDDESKLGPAGGFGQVFRGRGEAGEVAVKRLSILADEAAHREMNIGRELSGRSLKHVVPVLDFGQDADTERYYLVMPICDGSLQDRIKSAGKLDWDDARSAARDIVDGLSEVGDIVHRDLKPGNVLWHEGRWKIADFGIAKFVEDSTSLETLRGYLTGPYAAPEQWEGRRPTKATDVYALGCIFHAMLNGRPPFSGSMEDMQEAHRHREPPELLDVDPRIQSIVRLMLRKSPDSRPSLERIAKVLADTASKPLSTNRHALAEVASKVVQQQLAEETARRQIEEAIRDRKRLAAEAAVELNGILNRLYAEICEFDAVVRQPQSVGLGRAELSAAMPRVETFRNDQSRWDVAAFTILKLKCAVERIAHHHPAYYTYSATLFYGARPGDGGKRAALDFRWREVSFFNPFSQLDITDKPIALTPADGSFHIAFTQVMSGWQTAHGPVAIDAEDEESFIERWITLFTRAARGQLYPPTSMPIPASFFT